MSYWARRALHKRFRGESGNGSSAVVAGYTPTLVSEEVQRQRDLDEYHLLCRAVNPNKGEIAERGRLKEKLGI